MKKWDKLLRNEVKLPVKTLIAIPCMDSIPVGFAQSLLWLEKGENVSVLFKPNSLIYDSRNLISLTAIEQGFDRVMWFDSDMMFTPKTMKILQNDMDLLKCDLVTGLYFKRTGENLPVIYDQLEMPTTDDNGKPVKRIHEYVDYPEDQRFKIRGCGFGCVLTSTQLLKDVWDACGPAFAPFPWAGEDIAFCYRVNQLGRDMWCDSRVSCGHIGTLVYTEEFCNAAKKVKNNG